ncbi:hypothetical protein PMAYCL1PPCAC_17326, partial [Pristionchus mayeri]
EIVDYSLLIAQSYLLLRLSLARSSYLKTPFFYFFLLTGVDVQNGLCDEDFCFCLQFFYQIMNIFGVTGSTIGKMIIAAHRYAVMRHVNLMKDVWSDRIKFVLTGVLIFVSGCRCISVFFCGYSYVNREGVKLVSYFDDECTVVDKSESSVTYFAYIIVSLILTVLTSRQLYKIQQQSDVITKTKKFIMDQQRKMFIIVSVCTISHLIKAIHQFCWVFAAYFHLQFNAMLQATYSYPHYLATYSASITLVLFSPRVRELLKSRRDVEERNHAGITAILS